MTPKTSNPWKAELEGAPWDPAANSTEDMEPRITRGEMIEWLEQVRGAYTIVIDRTDRPALDAIIAYLKAH